MPPRPRSHPDRQRLPIDSPCAKPSSLMHWPALVVGEDVNEVLAPFSTEIPVDPYFQPLSADEQVQMSQFLRIPETDLPALCAKMPEWNGAQGLIQEGRLGWMSTVNPRGQYDWYRVGGQWTDFLHLLQPRRQRRLWGLLPGGWTSYATKARKRDVDQTRLLDDPPESLVIGTEWLERRFPLTDETRQQWKAEFAERFRTIDDAALLTVVDLHS